MLIILFRTTFSSQVRSSAGFFGSSRLEKFFEVIAAFLKKVPSQLQN